MARTSRKEKNLSVVTEQENLPEIIDTAIYVRLSVEDRDNDSIENQRDMLERYVYEQPNMLLKSTFIERMLPYLIQLYFLCAFWKGAIFPSNKGIYRLFNSR